MACMKCRQNPPEKSAVALVGKKELNERFVADSPTELVLPEEEVAD